MSREPYADLETCERVQDWVIDSLDPYLREPGDDTSSSRDLVLDAHPDELIDALHAAGLLRMELYR